MRNHVIGGLAVVLAVAAASNSAEAMAATVNCNNPTQSISKALNAGITEITVVGTCTETVEIRRDDVTITGLGNATLLGKVIVDGAGRINIKKLKVQGVSPDTGILLERGASAVLDNVTVQNAVDGVRATGNSYLEIVNGSVVQNNSATGIRIEYGSGALVTDSTCRNNFFDGLSVGNGGSAELRNNTIEGNGEEDGDSDVFVDQNGFARLTGNMITAHEPAEALTVRGAVVRLAGQNTISGEGFAAIDVFLGATLIQRGGLDTVNGPVQIQSSSSVEIRSIELHGDVNIDNDSIVNFSGGHVSEGFALARDSGLSLLGGLVDGSVECADEESSFFTNQDPVPVGGGVNCSGF